MMPTQSGHFRRGHQAGENKMIFQMQRASLSFKPPAPWAIATSKKGFADNRDEVRPTRKQSSWPSI